MWHSPENFDGEIRHYNLKIFHNGQTIYGKNTNDPYISLQGDLILDAPHTVIVTAVAHVEGQPASTNISFHNIGEGLCLTHLHLKSMGLLI